MPTIAILGDINVDLALQIQAYPPEGGEGIAERQAYGLGGSATNTARILASLGLSVHFIGKVGMDSWGDWSLQAVQQAGIDTRWIRRDAAEPTQLNIVVVSASGERTMFAYRGANIRLTAEEIDPAAFDGVALLHLSGYALLKAPQREAALHAIARAKDAAIAISLDIPAGITQAIAGVVRPLLPAIDTLFLGEADALALAPGVLGCDPDQAAVRLLDAGAGHVVIKRGPEGSVLHGRGHRSASRAIEVQAVDTTGAGDAFAAGYLFGIANRLPPVSAAALANAAGAIAVTTFGIGAIAPGHLLAMVEKSEVAPGQLRKIEALLRKGGPSG